MGKVGNLKIGADTLIFNMQPAHNCISDKLGLCKISSKCYAKKAEIQYSNTLEYRKAQEELWNIITALDFYKTIEHIALNKKTNKIKYLRINESGDITSLKDISKLLAIANLLYKNRRKIGLIVIYLYTKRKDLDFTILKECNNVVLNGSEFMLDNEYKVVTKNDTIEKDWLQCPNDCTKCNLCKVKKGKTIYNLIH